VLLSVLTDGLPIKIEQLVRVAKALALVEGTELLVAHVKGAIDMFPPQPEPEPSYYQ
jgi:hypothetical protein